MKESSIERASVAAPTAQLVQAVQNEKYTAVEAAVLEKKTLNQVRKEAGLSPIPGGDVNFIRVGK